MTEVVHLLCAPFPTAQGTQASVAAIVRAASRGDARHTLLVPAESHGAPPADLAIERLPRLPLRLGARSGPSLARVASDVATLATIRAHVRGRPLVAHNVEAAFIAAVARVPFVYVAHTSMKDELPLYGRGGRVAKARLGAMLDRIAVTAARRAVAITPSLAQSLEARFSAPVAYLPQPWEASPPVPEAERRAARAALGLGDALVVLHAGNLDRYQGLDRVIAAVRRAGAHRPTVLLVATESALSGLGPVDGVHVVAHPLAGEADRRIVHAAADVSLLARARTHGLPIKLLECFGRDVPVVATRDSLAGLALADELVTADDSPDALADAATRAVRDARAIRAAARAYLRRGHSAREAAAVLGAALRARPSLPRART